MDFLGSVAIYFRETHAGWAFSFKDEYERNDEYSQGRKIKKRHWLVHEKTVSTQVPICVLIEPDGRTLDSFGYDAEVSAKRMEHKDWFYFNRVTTGFESDVMLEDSAGKRLPAKLVFTLVFQYVKKDIMQNVCMGFGDFTEDIGWVLCFPAIWDDLARQFMMEAAQDAGIPGQNISVVSDSQAASACCRYLPMNDKCRYSSLHTLRYRRQYVIVNAEGRIVYLTVHEVLNGNKVREVHKSRIDCGGNDAFESFLNELVGADVMFKFKSECAEDYIGLFGDFKTKNPDSMSSNESTRQVIRIPKSLLNLVNMSRKTLTECIEKSKYQDCMHVQGDELSINFEVIKSLFIKSHVDRLRYDYQRILAIVMVGWFSNVKVFQECIQGTFFTIFIPLEPVDAVLDGAVVCGHNSMALVVERTVKCQSIQETCAQQLFNEKDTSPRGQGTQEICSKLPSYKMDRRPRGWCIILNVETVDGQPERKGTQYDKVRLIEVLRDKLHFLVQCHDNPTSTEVMKCLVDVSHTIDHTPFDCFVFCILSHGKLGHVYGSDGKAVPIKDLTSVFNASRCPSLGGKPKLFFIQACQGEGLMTGVTVPTDIQTDACQELKTPLEADFLFGYATVPGHVAYRRPQSGSWYMRALCNALTEYHPRYHLLEILTAVNSMVAQESNEAEGGVYKQIPAPQTTLTKLLYFR